MNHVMLKKKLFKQIKQKYLTAQKLKFSYPTPEVHGLHLNKKSTLK